MPGFQFRYRLSGKQPTIESFVLLGTETLSAGDMLCFGDGAVRLGATADTALVGAAVETVDGDAATRSIRVIVDADAVYGVEDSNVRLKGATLDLDGATGAQTVSVSRNAEFVVDVESTAGEETLIRINDDRHYGNTPVVAVVERPIGGELNAAVARAIVRFHSEQLGRGPTKAHAFYHNNIVVVVLEDVMTKAERSLVAAGRFDAVMQSKHAFQETMRPYLRSMIERLTGCKMLAFMSGNSIEPDLATELFILDRPLP